MFTCSTVLLLGKNVLYTHGENDTNIQDISISEADNQFARLCNL